MNVLFWGSCDFPVSYQNRDTWWNAWKRHSGSFMVDTGNFFSNMKSPLSRMYILTLGHLEWFPNRSDFHEFHNLDTKLDLHQVTSGFHGAFATDVECQQETLTLPDTSFRSPLWDLFILQLMRPVSPKLPCLFSTFHLEYPSIPPRFCLTLKRRLANNYLFPAPFENTTK